MSEDQAQTALARIEAALARIEAAAARPAPDRQADLDLAARHAALKDAVARTLGDLDTLIADAARP